MIRILQCQSIYRWSLLIGITLLWLYIGHYDVYIKDILKSLIINNYNFLNLSENSVFQNDTNFERLSTMFYHTFFSSLSIIIIHLLVNNKNFTLIFILFLSFAYGLTISVNEIGKSINFEPFRTTSYRMMTLIISPLPLLIFLIISYKDTYLNVNYDIENKS